MQQGLLICGHGSRNKEGVKAFEDLAVKMRERHPEKLIEHGFLELSIPTFEDGIRKLYDQGAREIIALPVFLFTGVHLKFDIPYQMKALEEKFEGLTIKLGSYIGVCQQLVNLSEKLICKAEEEIRADRKDSCFLALGIGASVAEANGDIAKLTRLVMENSNFGFCTNAFISRMASPSIPDTLDLLKHLPFKRIVMVPFIFFTGVYMDRIHDMVSKFMQETDKEVILTETFGSDDLVLDALEMRLQEVLDGKVDLTQNLDPNAEHHHHHHDHDHGHSHHHGHHHH
ncbi:MAG: sirohydrochlorin chelatase [Marinifilaceae bacterium]